MIRRVSGEIVEIREEGVVVSTASGLSYEVLVGGYAAPELRALMDAREPVELHTHHYLEGNVASGQLLPRLIGFLTAKEKELFLRFTRVQGLSPRSAIRAFALPPERIAAAVEAGDKNLLTKLPGIGKKKAEQIIARLRGELLDLVVAEEISRPGAGGGGAAQRAEAMAVLVGQLGYRTPEAEDLIERALTGLDPAAGTEDILKEVFRLSR